MVLEPQGFLGLELMAYIGLGASRALGLEVVADMGLGPKGLWGWSW